MTFGQGFNSDSALFSDTHRAKAITKTCTDCRCGIKRGLRCGPCRDIAAERRRQDAYAAKKAAAAIGQFAPQAVGRATDDRGA